MGWRHWVLLALSWMRAHLGTLLLIKMHVAVDLLILLEVLSGVVVIVVLTVVLWSSRLGSWLRVSVQVGSVMVGVVR